MATSENLLKVLSEVFPDYTFKIQEHNTLFDLIIVCNDIQGVAITAKQIDTMREHNWAFMEIYRAPTADNVLDLNVGQYAIIFKQIDLTQPA